MKNQLGFEIPASVLRSIHFSQPLNLRFLTEFYSIPDLVLASLSSEDIQFLEQKGKDGVAQIISRLERKLMKNREIIDLTSSETKLEPPIKNWVEGLCAVEKNHALEICFGLSGTYDLLLKSNRTSVSQWQQMQLTPQSKLILRSPFQFYWEERYSVALLGQDTSYALYASSAEGGGKGNARLLVKVLTQENLYIDDVAKYINTEIFLRGINI